MPRTADSQILNWPDEVYFHPWVGCNYEHGRGPNQRRLLIVGESHYCDSNEFIGNSHQCFTIDCIKEITAETWTHRFFTAAAEMVEGRKKWEIDLAEFWESVAFCNFIQECLDAPRAELLRKR